MRVRLLCLIVAINGQFGVSADESVGHDQFVLPGGAEIVRVDFERHVAGLFGRLGCNAGMCHGSFEGQGGFRLSLFGQSPQMDYAAIVGTGDALRIDRAAPDNSLLLRKPSLRDEHEGGLKLRVESWEYRLIRRWIAEGARHTSGSAAVRALTLEPSELQPLAVGQTVPLKVVARFVDGQQENVSAFSEFRSRDDSIVEVDSSGTLTARAPGATAIIVAYHGAFASVPVIVPFSGDDSHIVTPASSNLIDQEINARLRLLALTASPLTNDAEFLRRATLDVLGTLPTPDEVRRFVADEQPDKRLRTIDALLNHPWRAAVWASKLCDITACNIEAMESPEPLRAKRAKMWHDWFRKRFADNVRYDDIVHGVLCATSLQGQPVDTWIDEESALLRAAEVGFDSNYAQRASLDLFWRRSGPNGPVAVEDLAELTASAFLGLRLHCARCHHHPYDRWSQRDFAGYAGIFARVQFGSSTELRTAMNNRLEARRIAREQGAASPELLRVQEVFLSASRRPLVDAASESNAVPQALHGPALEDETDPREGLFRWLVQPDNPYFAKNFVNRVWAKYLGAGLVEPVDALSPANPPSHPQLLDRLAAEFLRSGYDIVHLERLILSSQAYQRSSRPTGNNAPDRDNFARTKVRPLPAETLLDALNAALESSDDFGPDVPAGSRAIELAPNRFSQRSINDLFRILGRGDRKSLCDCDRAVAPSIRQPIYLMSDPRVLQKITAGRLARLLNEHKSDEAIMDEFYLATFSRLPDDDERGFLLQHVSDGSDRTAALADVVWALINSREFVTNH